MNIQRQDYIDYIWLQSREIIWLLWSFISSYSIFLILGYISIIIILIIAVRYLYKTHLHVWQVLQKSIDDALYKQNLSIYRNQHNIYNMSESLPILYAHSRLMLSDPSLRDYTTSYPWIKKDIEYTEQFLSSPFNIQWKDIDTLYQLASSLKDRYHTMHQTLKYLTLWIAKFFI